MASDPVPKIESVSGDKIVANFIFNSDFSKSVTLKSYTLNIALLIAFLEKLCRCNFLQGITKNKKLPFFTYIRQQGTHKDTITDSYCFTQF
jgi:hypothetical protein